LTQFSFFFPAAGRSGSSLTTSISSREALASLRSLVSFQVPPL